MRRTTHALAVPVVLLLAAGIAACGGEVPVGTTPGAPTSGAQETPGSGGGTTDKPTTGATDTPEAGNGESETVSVTSLKTGDCFNPQGDSSKVTTVERVYCDSPHAEEVFHVADIDDSRYTTAPNKDEMTEEVRYACARTFEDYVGIELGSTIYSVHAYNPTPDSWTQGDRTIICLIADEDGNPLTGSARDSKK